MVMYNNLYLVWILIFISSFLFALNGFSDSKDLLSKEKMYEDVKYYSDLGHHRTATEVDHATSRWLKERLQKAGYSTQIQEWETKQFFPQETYIEINRMKRFRAFPVWWPKPTYNRGIMAKLSSDLQSVRGKILLFRNVTGPGFSVDRKLIKQVITAADNGSVAVVVATFYNRSNTIASNEFIGLNAMQINKDEWPIPVVMIQAKDFNEFEKAETDQLAVRIISTGFYNQSAVAMNVIGSLMREPDYKTIIVTTPSSGWFNCAGERGSGIGIWLALAEWASKKIKNINWIFAATSGHELRGLGTDHLLNSDLVPPPNEVDLWTHVGAWQAMYSFILKDGALRKTDEMDDKILQFTGNDLGAAVNEGFGDPQLRIRIVPQIRFGDLIQVEQFGYKRLAGISFGHEYHHSTQDLPNVTGPALLESIAKAYKTFLQAYITNQL